MNIINERIKNIVLFKDLNIGDVFNITGEYYIRVKEYHSSGIKLNSFSLIDFDIYFFDEDEAVTKVEADLYIK